MACEKDMRGARDAPEGPEPRGHLGPGMRLLACVAAGLVALGLGVAAFATWVLPANGAADPSKLYDYVYASGKSENADFVLNNMSAEGYLCFGSSEFYISKSLVSMVPQAVFGENNTGVDMTFIGEGYDQSLWQAIAAGAYGSRVPNKKVTLIVSPQWFFRGNGEQRKFYTKFSYSLYRTFMQNPDVSDDTKAAVRARCSALGIDDATLAAGARDTPLDALNDVAYAATDAWRLRSDLNNIVQIAPSKSLTRQAGTPTGEPDWDALLGEARSEGAAATTSNDYGVYDAFWEKNHGFDPELFQDFSEADAEYDDLALFLQVCREVGLEPLVCILPVNGAWYDVSDVTADERSAYYARVRGICDDADVAYADFSSCEYEKYFLCDTVHPGWVGWVRIERSFYDFVNGRDDAFLGGGGYGDAEGLAAAATDAGGEPQ